MFKAHEKVQYMESAIYVQLSKRWIWSNFYGWNTLVLIQYSMCALLGSPNDWCTCFLLQYKIVNLQTFFVPRRASAPLKYCLFSIHALLSSISSNSTVYIVTSMITLESLFFQDVRTMTIHWRHGVALLTSWPSFRFNNRWHCDKRQRKDRHNFTQTNISKTL